MSAWLLPITSIGPICLQLPLDMLYLRRQLYIIQLHYTVSHYWAQPTLSCEALSVSWPGCGVAVAVSCGCANDTMSESFA